MGKRKNCLWYNVNDSILLKMDRCWCKKWDFAERLMDFGEKLMDFWKKWVNVDGKLLFFVRKVNRYWSKFWRISYEFFVELLIWKEWDFYVKILKMIFRDF